MTASRVRQQRAQQTRQRICASARDLFLSQGYTATTVTDIARAAGVAHQTVYFVFGSKAAVLSAIMDTEIVGDLDAVPLLDRPQVQALAKVADPRRRLERIVGLTCDITHRLAPLYEIVRGGASDDDVRALLDRHEQQRWRSIRGFVGLLDGDLATGLTADEAADRLFALLSHDVLWMLVHRRGWSVARWREYVTTTAAQQVLAAEA